MRGPWIFLIACSAAIPAQAQQAGIAIQRGEEVIAALSGDPVIARIESRTATTPNADETGKGAEFARGAHDDAMGANFKILPASPGAPPPPMLPGKLRLRFTAVAGSQDGSLLVLQNGYDRALVYRATITAKGRSAPTDVCMVLPARSGIEHWPYPIERIELGGLRLEPWQPGDAVRCE